MKRKILYMGSSEYSLTILKNLISEFPIALVATQPDKPAGRGKITEPALLKKAAEELSIPVIQPEKINDNIFWETIQAFSIDLIIVAAYGKILPKRLLDFPEFGCLNVHASFLPRWRGASPIQAAIIHGDRKSGATIIRMDEGIDTGPIISQRAIEIDTCETSQTLSTKLAQLGSDLLLETLPKYLDGRIQPQQQTESKATYSGLIKKEDGLLDFGQSAENLERKIRAFFPWPICYMTLGSEQVRIYKAEATNEKRLEKFQRGIINKYPSVGTATDDLILLELQVAGKKIIDGKAFLNGARNWLSQENIP